MALVLLFFVCSFFLQTGRRRERGRGGLGTTGNTVLAHLQNYYDSALLLGRVGRGMANPYFFCYRYFIKKSPATTHGKACGSARVDEG
jgi:hypothetical protein